MPSVFGLDIRDERMAKIARTLLRAHLAVVGLAVVQGLLEIGRYFALAEAAQDVHDLSGMEPPSTSIASGAGVVITNIVVPLLCPVAILLVARSAVQQSNRDLMQAVCLCDGCCTGCIVLAILAGLASIAEYGELLGQVSGYRCDDRDVGRMKAMAEEPERYNERHECEAAVRSTASVFRVVLVTAILATLLALCELCLCCMGTYSSSRALGELRVQRVFDGMPPTQQATRITVQPSGPNTPIVVGQPIGVMGAPSPTPATSTASWPPGKPPPTSPPFGEGEGVVARAYAASSS
mmetsp:Transcript_3122/g.8960  ORF Transcript_3122/g.8960 Transcript_3122/m.8960 type:complete len:294 (-) Transcript_3122:90-971(-)